MSTAEAKESPFQTVKVLEGGMDQRGSIEARAESTCGPARIGSGLEMAAQAASGPRQPEPAPLGEAAFHGLAGRIVHRIEPHSEADPAAILVQLLIAFGNLVGRGPHFRVEESEHFGNEFCAIVGRSAKARKGTSFNRVVGLLAMADPEWQRDCHAHGLVSGEGIIHAVRDDAPGKKEGEIIPGVRDKRLLLVEEELGGVLSVAGRKDNSLTAVLRSCWDSKDLRTLAKNSHERATAPHISLIGHITLDELKAKLRGHELSNGFANRFLWIYARRSQLLPDGGNLRTSELHGEGEALRAAAATARTFSEIRRTPDAAELWREKYAQLSAERRGIVGDVTSRMEAHAVRLALIYALLDGSAVVGVAHLWAALAVCDYALRSAEHCFGGLSLDARAIHAALSARVGEWVTRTEISTGIFKGHKAAEQIDTALHELETAALAEHRTEATSGAPRELWRAAKKGN